MRMWTSGGADTQERALPPPGPGCWPPLDVHGGDGAPNGPTDEVGRGLVEVHHGPHVHDQLVRGPRSPR
eukprot:3272501-Pyramimonas_sp.AAC.1